MKADDRSLDQDSIEDHIAKLKSTDRAVLHDSIRALGRLRASEAVRPLGILLGRTDNSNTRNMIAKTLGKIGDRGAVPILIKHYNVIAPSTFSATLVRLGLFADVFENKNDLASKRERRKMMIAIRRATPELIQLIEQDRLTADEIRRVLPPTM
ncbi:MAG: HEAT repeat domain-containing protein [Planctomycetota bacterium]